MKKKIIILITGLIGIFIHSEVFAKDRDIDSAIMRVKYEYRQTFKDGSVRIDTMALDTGLKGSVFYDATKEVKGQRHSELSTKTTKRIVKDSYEELLERIATLNQSEVMYPLLDYISTVIYKERYSEEVITTDIISSRFKSSYTESITEEWRLGEGEYSILGYKCQFATIDFRGRSYECWYTTDLPLNDGPWKFYGLPGQILMIESRDGQIRFNAISVERLDSEIIVFEDEDHYDKCKNLKQMNEFILSVQRLARSVAIQDQNGVVSIYHNPNINVPLLIEKEY